MYKDIWRKKFLPYFLFTRKERRGIYVLLAVITAMWIIPYFFSSPVSEVSVEELAVINTAIDSLEKLEKPAENGYPERGEKKWVDNRPQKTGSHSRYVFSPGSLFVFNPNTATAAQWKELGLPDKTIGTLMKYLSKGGRIRKPEELQKIYGFPEEAYEMLKPYIRLPENQVSYPEHDKKIFAADKSYPKPYREKSMQVSTVLINQSDSAAWESLPGIGPKLASRIISYRSKLGGFHSIEQVGETFGLPDSVFTRIRPLLVADGQSMPAKLDLNHASLEELQAHPYISYQLAKVIVAYRKQHGAFNHKSDLQKIALVTPDLFVKLEPYIDVY
jgi:competence protein ComEA